MNNSRAAGPSTPSSCNPADHIGKTILLGLAGQPNVGKSTIFNLLTGLSQHVGNWPGKTVERKEGMFSRNGMPLRIVDLPGTYSLTANSIEERVARDFILHESPDLIVMVADASALERNLYLLSELLLLPAPVILALNMMDVAESQGVQMEPHVLEAALGLPVVPLIASKNRGVSELVDSIEHLRNNPERFHPVRPQIAKPHRQVLTEVQSLLSGQVPEPYVEGWVALKLLEGDTEIAEKAGVWLPREIGEKINAVLKEHEDAVLDIASGRYEWIARMVRASVTRPRLGQVSVTDRLDKVAVHPLWGLVLLLSAFGLVFWLTFTLAAPVQEWLDLNIVGGLRSWLTGAMAWAPTWVVRLLTEGVLGGAGIVITFLPILAVFYAALGFLEDSGYLARAAYIMDRFMHYMGLHGKSFLPLFLGFGCNVPAVMGTRVIASPGGRLLTILLAPLVPCSARLVVLAFLAPIFFDHLAPLVSWSLVSLNLLVLALVGALLSKTLFRGQHSAFIMELPLYHLPNPRTIGIFIWNNICAFLRKAATLIVLFSVLIWALSSYPGSHVEQSYLAQFGRTLDPLAQLMGMDWRMIMALLSSFIAKENAIATLSILYGTGQEVAGLAETMAEVETPAAALAFLVVSMLFIPCAATVAVMLQETRSWRWTVFSVVLLLGIALGAGIAIYQCAQWLGLGT